MIKSNCAICYKEFTFEKGRKKCCSKECARERQNLLRRWNNLIEDNPKKRKRKKKILTIAEVNKLAREKGMTYGEYLAKTEGGMR